MKRLMIPTVGALATGAVLLFCLLMSSRSLAYDEYSVNRDATNCRACHGDFRATPYTSKVDGQSWGDDLHDVHRNTMLGGDCDVCHFSGRFPAYIGKSTGGSGSYAAEPFGCAGCHGRAADGTGSTTIPTEGYGAGLRQLHFRAGQTLCINCHTDSNPANKTVAKENVLPPYYDNNDASHTAQPTNPCNPSPAFNENFKASTLGLDNDGNGQFDMADTACQPVTATPGEVSRSTNMTVTAYDKLSGNVTVAYGVACAATNNNIEYGALSSLSTYAYSGQVCALGNAGSATFTVPNGSFFLVVGNNGTKEGSYGKRRSTGTLSERPEDTTSVACPVPQDLVNRCDGP